MTVQKASRMVVLNLRHLNFALVYESCFVATGVFSFFSMEFDSGCCSWPIGGYYPSPSDLGRRSGGFG